MRQLSEGGPCENTSSGIVISGFVELIADESPTDLTNPAILKVLRFSRSANLQRLRHPK